MFISKVSEDIWLASELRLLAMTIRSHCHCDHAATRRAKVEKQSKNKTALFFVSLTPTLILFTSPLCAAGGALPGHTLSLWWALPFVGMLASLALLPLFAIHFWEAHYGKVALGWSLLTIVFLISIFGTTVAKIAILGTFFHHFLPFVIIIGALYTIAGGIQIKMESNATPFINTCLLAVGTFLAGWIGTTGASMLLIRPFLHINRDRQMRIHHMIFFIFLVANIGGALTPLGDPPLFIGFLNGVTFFWPLKHLFLPMVMLILLLLLMFFALDKFFAMREKLKLHTVKLHIKIKGKWNGLLFLGVIGFVLLSGLWKSGLTLHIGEVYLDVQNVIRDIGLVFLALVSWVFTPSEIYKDNQFSWEPLKEVVKLFFGIFMTVIPVIAILDAGINGALAPLISLVDVDGHPQNGMYFWLSGGLSSVLDNAPTYLVFFHMAGGDATNLMSSLARTLEAISLGAVFMGALTYIGNAPNFIVKSIAESHKIKMPSFFGYMAWSLGILLPLFILLSWWRF